MLFLSKPGQTRATPCLFANDSRVFLFADKTRLLRYCVQPYHDLLVRTLFLWIFWIFGLLFSIKMKRRMNEPIT